MPSPIDILIISLTILLPVLYLFRDSLPLIGAKQPVSLLPKGASDVVPPVVEKGDPRDFVDQLERSVSVDRAKRGRKGRAVERSETKKKGRAERDQERKGRAERD
jgi:NADPH-ferrihemoprotein reductase